MPEVWVNYITVWERICKGFLNWFLFYSNKPIIQTYFPPAKLADWTGDFNIEIQIECSRCIISDYTRRVTSHYVYESGSK